MKKLAYIILLLLPFITTCNKWYDDYDNLETVLTNGVWVFKKQVVYMTAVRFNTEGDTIIREYPPIITKDKDINVNYYIIFTKEFNRLLFLTRKDSCKDEVRSGKVFCLEESYAKMNGEIYRYWEFAFIYIWFKMILYQYDDSFLYQCITCNKFRVFSWSQKNRNIYIRYKTKCINRNNQYIFYSEDSLMLKYTDEYTKPYINYEVEKYSDKYLYLHSNDTDFRKVDSTTVQMIIYDVDMVLKNVRDKFDNIELHVFPEDYFSEE